LYDFFNDKIKRKLSTCGQQKNGKLNRPNQTKTLAPTPTEKEGRMTTHARTKDIKKKPIERANPFGRWTKPTAPRAEIQRSGQTHDLAQRHQNTLPP